MDRSSPYNINGVQSYIRVSTTVLPINESIDLDIGLINNGNDPVYIYGQLHLGFGGGLLVHVKDVNGKVVPRDAVWDAMLPPPSPNSRVDIFVKLNENSEFFGIHVTIPVKDLVNAPGTYFIQVEYLSPLSCSFLKFFKKKKTFIALPILWREVGPVYSHWIKFRVTREKSKTRKKGRG